jgi:hypothetical protein
MHNGANLRHSAACGHVVHIERAVLTSHYNSVAGPRLNGACQHGSILWQRSMTVVSTVSQPHRCLTAQTACRADSLTSSAAMLARSTPPGLWSLRCAADREIVPPSVAASMSSMRASWALQQCNPVLARLQRKIVASS